MNETAFPDAALLAAVEAVVYAADEPATIEQIAGALAAEPARVAAALSVLAGRYRGDEHGIEIKAVAGGYRMATKPEHHEAVRQFIKSLKPPVRLSLPALETLAVIAYRQPVTAPEIKEIRGVDPSGVLNTLLEKKLIAAAGRKEVIGKPILYKTTREFLVRFGLNGLEELPTLKEFEELAMAGLEGLEPAGGEAAGAAPETPAPPAPAPGA
ncbi:MAG TPA: SMC-Scp complex subunit ScpB [Terriglobales bacterium]|nr:SMC-Scp complex subunit ScpB [Terriglobales bacterium]